ncbi:ParB N-terminal domain-containing protein (plasmid) [Macrococcus psychrotolerans]|uniref:ParB N-terminal domain-containing protein n=1 Tax=Macrococcus psychrotolerans TaxID=3039389 RepID=A0AAT9P8P3_9STAP|nr:MULTISPECIES: ParB N-terminal domain-containing protein [Macrococcus]QYA34080.1 ParB N-terminal domain-containing protein [Macrococcus sp. 19Msa1099]QYA38865.1 ParB N-terminal domain-containing protein [Macrococcus caseolyticus]QYA77588.1 ParB N-terminal domain-containing protein [Macrococcus caseolyticus]
MELRFIEINNLVLHEYTEKIRFQKLITKIEEEGVQKSPIIVTKIDNYYLVLDGAHRYTCLKALKYKYILCQIINSEEYYIDTWQHTISKDDYANHIQILLKNERFSKLDSEKDKDILQINTMNDENTPEPLESYIQFVDCLNKCNSFKRVHKNEYSKDSVKVIYPEVDEELIKLLVNKNRRIPAGISKVNLKCGRILGVSIPLQILNENTFHDIYIDKIMNNIRKYEETIYLYEGMIL